MLVRRAQLADAPALVACWAQMFSELGAAPADAELLRGFRDYLIRKLPAPDFAAWLGEAEGEVLSTASLILYEIPGRATITHEAYAINVFTVRGARGRGLARQVMRALVAHARTLPVRKLWLRTSPQARTLYERVGFTPRSELMELDLRKP